MRIEADPNAASLAAGVDRQQRRWIMKFELRSPRYTARLDEVPVVPVA